MKSVVKNATKETIEELMDKFYPETDIFDRLLEDESEEVFDLREKQFESMAPPHDVDIGDITYESPTKLPMESRRFA